MARNRVPEQTVHFNASVLSKLPSSCYHIAEEETVDVPAPVTATVLFQLRFLFVFGMCRMFIVQDGTFRFGVV